MDLTLITQGLLWSQSWTVVTVPRIQLPSDSKFWGCLLPECVSSLLKAGRGILGTNLKLAGWNPFEQKQKKEILFLEKTNGRLSASKRRPAFIPIVTIATDRDSPPPLPHILWLYQYILTGSADLGCYSPLPPNTLPLDHRGQIASAWEDST